MMISQQQVLYGYAVGKSLLLSFHPMSKLSKDRIEYAVQQQEIGLIELSFKSIDYLETSKYLVSFFSTHWSFHGTRRPIVCISRFKPLIGRLTRNGLECDL